MEVLTKTARIEYLLLKTRDCPERSRHLNKAAEEKLYQAGDKFGLVRSAVGFLQSRLICKFLSESIYSHKSYCQDSC